jgi:hypothetical protein
MEREKVIYEWGLYDVVADDHFEFSATPQQIAEAMPDPDISVRLIRYQPDEGWEDCHITADGTFEFDGVFACGNGRHVPKRFVEQVARWVKKYGYELRSEGIFGDE